MSGSTSRNKGYRGEKRFREMVKDQGFEVIWHNNEPTLPDVTVEDLTGEIKFKKSIPKTIYKYLNQDEADFVAMRRVSQKEKNRDWLVTMRLDLFFKLLKRSVEDSSNK